MIKKIVGTIARRLFDVGPFGLSRIGLGSRILLPRKIHGRNNIKIGCRTIILSNSWLSAIENYQGVIYSPKICIGDDVYIGRHSCIVSMNEIRIESGCVLSEHVYIADNSHGLDPRAGLIMNQKLSSKGPVIIGKNTFIGYRAVIVPGVTLGDHCVVGANSVVTRSFPNYSMIAGCPAQLIKTFDHQSGNWLPV